MYAGRCGLAMGDMGDPVVYLHIPSLESATALPAHADHSVKLTTDCCQDCCVQHGLQNYGARSATSP